MNSLATIIEKYFLLIALVLTVAALVWPALFAWIAPHISVLLGVIMFGMGLTLEFRDFKRVWIRRRLVVLGTLLQFTIMPVLAILTSRLLRLSPEMTVGMVIVGACPGGTASNVITYLARANVPLSIVLTLVSTLLAPLVTPLIVYLILHRSIAVAFLPMVLSVFWIIAFPVMGGLFLHHFFKERIRPFVKVFPSISILGIALVIASIMALNRATLLAFPVFVILGVMLHNMGGLLLGYLASKYLGCREKDARTISIEVGMQNSGLGVALAHQFFSAASALPSAIFSLWHNMTGIVLAKYWAGKKPQAEAVKFR